MELIFFSHSRSACTSRWSVVRQGEPQSQSCSHSESPIRQEACCLRGVRSDPSCGGARAAHLLQPVVRHPMCHPFFFLFLLSCLAQLLLQVRNWFIFVVCLPLCQAS